MWGMGDLLNLLIIEFSATSRGCPWVMRYVVWYGKYTNMVGSTRFL